MNAILKGSTCVHVIVRANFNKMKSAQMFTNTHSTADCLSMCDRKSDGIAEIVIEALIPKKHIYTYTYSALKRKMELIIVDRESDEIIEAEWII